MATCHVLRLDETGLTAYRSRRGSVQAESEFPPGADGLEHFRAYLAKHRSDLFYLFANVAAEGFEIADIPHVGGRDHTALVQRKLTQHFYGTSLTAALTRERLDTGRRDDRMLFAALTRPQYCEPWLEALGQAEVALAGIFSAAQTATGLLAATGRMYQRALLMTLTRGGLRQTVLDGGRLRFSRLAPLVAGSPEEAAAMYVAEATRIHQYLAEHRLFVLDEPLTVVVLVHPNEADAFHRHLHNSDALRFDILDLVAVAGRCGLATTLADSRCDALLAHLLIRDTPRRQFASGDMLRFFHLRQIRRGLASTGLAICVSCCLFSVKQLLDRDRSLGNALAVQMQYESANETYQTALRSLPPLPLSTTEQLRSVVDRYEELLRVSPSPEPLYRHLGAAFDAFPAIELERLNWTLSNHVDGAPSERGNATPAAPSGSMATPIFAVADVYGLLPQELSGDHRRQNEVIEEFAERLRSNARYEVRVLSRSFETASNAEIKHDGDTAHAQTPRFTLRVAHRL